MQELGMKDKIFGSDLLRPIDEIVGYERPMAMPVLSGDESVICGYNQGLGERIIVCESLQDMQELYDNYASGWALTINWYAVLDPGFITVISGQGQDSSE